MRVERSPLVLMRVATVVPCLAAMWDSVSPRTTVWVAATADGAGAEVTDGEGTAAGLGIVSICPTRISASRSRPLASTIAATDVPVRCAMSHTESPTWTWYVIDTGAVGTRTEALTGAAGACRESPRESRAAVPSTAMAGTAEDATVPAARAAVRDTRAGREDMRAPTLGQ